MSKDFFIPPPTNIALVDFNFHGTEAAALRGIQKFGVARGWNFHYAYNEKLFQEIQMNRDLLAGILVSVKSSEKADILREMNLPIVNISNAFPERDGFPAVLPDEEEIARVAVEHLLHLGFRKFAVSPFPMQYEERSQRERGIAFANEVRRQGFPCYGMEVNDEIIPTLDARHLDGFLAFREVDEPLGLFTCSDHVGERWLFLARHFRRRVPESLAVVGCGDFDVICQLANPPLSSVQLSGEEIGYQASQLLADLIAGKNPKPLRLIAPQGINIRQSTNIIAVQNRPLAKALQYIFDHAPNPITAVDVVRASGVNRRELERNFKEVLNRTILEQIYFERIKRARRLLEDDKERIADIAEMCGFQDHSHLCRVFKRYGQGTPQSLRKKNY